MTSLVRIVVGNSCASFAKNESVVTFAMIEPELERLGRHHTLVVGQGLTSKERETLRALGSSSRSGPRVLGGEPPSPRELTHKASVENVLCSTPIREPGTTTYKCTLLLSPAVDRLVDHTTGQHVNGMVLIEATRQAAIAAIERHYLRIDSRRWGFSWSGCNSRFVSFAFPVPTQITIHLPDVPDFESRQQVPLTMPIVVEQAGGIVCEVLMEVTLIEADLVHRLESRRAKRIVASVLSQVAEAEQLAEPRECAGA